MCIVCKLESLGLSILESTLFAFHQRWLLLKQSATVVETRFVQRSNNDSSRTEVSAAESIWL